MVRHRRGVHAGTVGDDDAPVARSLQVDLLIASADHANDFQQRQGGDFLGMQPQRATGQHSLDLRAMGLDGLGAFGGRRREDHMKVIALDDVQVFVDGFNKDQNSGGHGAALVVGFETGIMRHF